MKEASDWGLSQISSSIDSAEGYLEMVHRVPADGYTNMTELEKAYLEPGHDREDNEKIGALVQKEYDSMTPEEKAAYDKIHNAGHIDDEDQTDQE